ncbi:hypothetical protein BV25DRAFT_1819805 [Artomyces pyxidatus]|uniref:Uncharacterized protein n=1 Tax=Artomyces pyxidatus TaxID=48021 RepID=A0ACB8TGA1_9AGAM|nr:hypothetical protein BV25DRAFT_1819805 [Artomyces pyxidatus]
MYAAFAFTSLLALVPLALGQDMMINTPSNAVVCEPLQLSWTGGTPPYYIFVVPAGQPAASPLKQFPKQDETEMTWVVDLPSSYNCAFGLKDATGKQVFTATVAIVGGRDDSCVNDAVFEGDSSSSMGSSASSIPATATQMAMMATTKAATTAPHTSTQPPTMSQAPAIQANKSGAGSSSSASSTPSPSAATNANSAEQRGAGSAFGIAGIMGLVGAVLL